MTKLSKEYLSKNWRRSYQPIIMSVPPIGSRDNVVFLVDVLANFRNIDINRLRLNTFAELSDNLVDYVLSIYIRSTRIDVVLDTIYRNRKLNERLRTRQL